jgi:hypothetical protein
LEAIVRIAKYVIAGVAVMSAGMAQAAGIGVRAGTTGVGGDVAFSVAPTLSARVGFSGAKFNFGDVDTDSGVRYDTKLKLSNLNTFIDFSPLGPFRLTGGFIFNDNRVDVRSEGGASGSSLSGNVKAGKSAAPYLGIGYGNVSGMGINFYADLGIMFMGSPRANLSANCGSLSAGDCTTLRNQVAAEERRLEDELKRLKNYPVLNIGLTIGF